jgi:hypothetical protein
MLTGYFDASGSEDDLPASVVAGFIQSVNAWAQFTDQWQEMLDDFRVPYLHMKEFNHSVKAFADWKGDGKKRAAFIESYRHHRAQWMLEFCHSNNFRRFQFRNKNTSFG